MTAKDGKPSYEEARDELSEIVESLEDGSATLEESLKLWERGEELAKICQEWLDGALAKIETRRKIEATKKAAE
jgi:exodeoxyribonuclease VII small subunit